MYFLSVLGSKKNINVKQKRGLRSAINNYWMRLSRISWFVSGEQINYCNNWSMRHGQITIFCNNRVQLSFSQWVCFFNEYLAFCHFYTKLIARRRKAWFHLCMSRVLFVAKHSWTTLPMSRPLFVYSYLQVTCMVGSLPMKRKKYLYQMII